MSKVIPLHFILAEFSWNREQKIINCQQPCYTYEDVMYNGKIVMVRAFFHWDQIDLQIVLTVHHKGEHLENKQIQVPLKDQGFEVFKCAMKRLNTGLLFENQHEESSIILLQEMLQIPGFQWKRDIVV